MVQIWDSCKIGSLAPYLRGILCPPEQGTHLEKRQEAEEESLVVSTPQLFGEADDLGPPQVKQTSRKVAGLDLSFLRSAQLDCLPGTEGQNQEAP